MCIQATFVSGFGTDILVLVNFAMNNEPLFASLYVVIVAVSIYLAVKEVEEGKKVVNTGDVSDAIMNDEAFTYYIVTDYQKFRLFMDLEEMYSMFDVVQFLVYFSLQIWKRVLFVNTPQLIIAFIGISRAYEEETNCYNDGESIWFARACVHILFACCILYINYIANARVLAVE